MPWGEAVAGPSGTAITTRLRLMPGDEYVLDLLAEHLGRLRRADLAGVTRPAPLKPTLDGAAKRRARRDRLNNRKRALTAESSARWNTSQTPNAADMSCPATPCSATGPMSGGPGSPVVSRSPTRSPAKPNRAGCYLTWPCPAKPSDAVASHETEAEVRADGPVVGVDLNDGHLALRRLDAHGNPVGRPERIDVDVSGSSSRRDAHVRHAITRLIYYARRHGIDAIAIEDLNFADARTVGRETMGSGQRGKRFRKTVASIPTAVFRNRLSAQTSRHRIRPRFHGAATGRCDTHATGGSRGESYQPGCTRKPAGDQEPPPARDTGNHIPPARPGKNAATEPGNRYPGNGQQRPTCIVAVILVAVSTS
ncbi:MAG TPA: hypothetical protein VF328_18780 [Mycobacterium sp.]